MQITYYYPALFFAGYFLKLDSLLLIGAIVLFLYFFVSKIKYKFVIASYLFLLLGFFTNARDNIYDYKTYEIIYADDEILRTEEGGIFYHNLGQDLYGIKKIRLRKKSVIYDKDKKIVNDFSVVTISETRDNFISFLKKNNASNLMIAFLTGERYFENEENLTFLKTGTMHLVAISAFHIGILFSFFIFLRRFFAIFPLSHFKTAILLNLLKFLVVLFYLYLTGFQTPTVRAAVFIGVLDLLSFYGIPVHPIFAFIISLISTSVFVPDSLLSYSFVMSAVSVFAILMIWKNLPDSQLVKITAVSLVISFFLLPITTQLSGFFSAISPLSNIIAIPLASLIMPLTFIIQLSYFISENLASYLIEIFRMPFSILETNLDFFSSISEKFIIPAINPPFYISVIFYLSAALIFLSKKWIKFLSVLLVFLFSLFFFFPILNKEEIRVLKSMPGKFYCFSAKDGSGYVFEDYRYRKYDLVRKRESDLILNLERELSLCQITNLTSLHLEKELPENVVSELFKRMRYKNTEIFFKEREIRLKEGKVWKQY